MDRIYDSWLYKQHDEVMALAAASDRLMVVPHPETPPRAYVVRFDCLTLVRAGGDVTLSGKVAQDARVAGGNVTISGQINRNATLGGGSVHLTDSAHIEGNLLVGAGNLQLAGLIDRDARIGAGNVTLSNKIGGDLAVAAAAIRLTSKASVGGHFRHWSDEAPSIDEGATVLGTVTKHEIPEVFKGEEFRRGFAGMKLGAGAVSVASTLILGLLLLRI